VIGSQGFLFLVSWPPHTHPWPIQFTPPAWLNIFAYARELAPAHPPLAFAVTPPGWLDYALTRISNARLGFFLFCLGRPFVVADGFGYVV
jgi:hypothetical protein